MRRIYLRDAASGDIVEDVFVITDKQFAAASTGKHYIKAFVSDRTSQITARMWNATRDIFNCHARRRLRSRSAGGSRTTRTTSSSSSSRSGRPRTAAFDVGDLHAAHDEEHPRRCAASSHELLRQRSRTATSAAIVQAYLDDEQLMDDFCKRRRR